MTAPMQPNALLDEARLAQVADRVRAVLQQVGRVYVGPPSVTEQLLVALFAGGHALLEGVPGVAKTTLAKTFAGTLRCSFRRIQFTPDLMPADITGSYVLSPKDGQFQLRQGPIFANLVLSDEINRAPAKTQSALLEAMQEAQTTIDGETRALPQPFMVLATQNPVEQAGTYPLPEAQIDRFLVRIMLGYPEVGAEVAMLERFGHDRPAVAPVLSPEEVVEIQRMATHVHAERAITDFIVRLVGYTRHHGHLLLGASPRASLSLLQACQARALAQARPFVIPDDVKALALPVLSHRLVLTPEAEMEGITTDSVVAEALAKVPHRAEARAPNPAEARAPNPAEARASNRPDARTRRPGDS